MTRRLIWLMFALGCAGYPKQQDRPPDLSQAVDRAANWWGSPASVADGWTIETWNSRHACGYISNAAGCTDANTLTVGVLPQPNCTWGLLLHEMGHVILGDPYHRDPRFAIADQTFNGVMCP